MDVDVFRDRFCSLLGENLKCLVHMGSRVRGEARVDSDYDFALIVHQVNREVLDGIRDILLDYQNVSVYILEQQELRHLPKALYATNLQFVHSEVIHGECNFPRPSAEDIDTYVGITRSDEVFALRHYLTLPHDPKRLVELINIRLKIVYFCLTYLIFKETGFLPRTRLETIAYLKKKDSHRIGVALLEILENWPTLKTSAAERTREYLHMVEEFWRTLEA
jgi:hypothetical protein